MDLKIKIYVQYTWKLSHLTDFDHEDEGSLPACQSALQPWVSLGLLYNQSPPSVRFLDKIIFYRMGLLAPCPTPNLEDQSVSLTTV
jgi:hypothetical protein